MTNDKKYKVLVDDNFHYMDESERYEAGSYSILEEAINRCREITLRSLKEHYEKGILPAKLRAQWAMFGEDPFVFGANSVVFSASDYITDEMCEEIIAEQKVSYTKEDMEKKPKWTPEDDKWADQMAQHMVDNLNRNVARDNSMFSPIIRDALRFALETHEINQKQKRKGKDIPYITHPLTVGLILARAAAPDYLVAAGILHDTLEDSTPEHKVTHEILSKRFGPSAADVVESVTEPDKDLSWKERKQAALEHLQTIEGPGLWVKTADVISNVSEILDDHEHDGDAVFERFNAPREDIIANYSAVIEALLKRWGGHPFGSSENPMVLDLKALAYNLEKIASN